MSLHEFLKYITDVGDSAVLAAIALVSALYFTACRYHREAIAMVLSFALTGAAIAVLKIIFITCGQDILDIHSPSGHAALSVGVLGMLALILTKTASGVWKRILPPFLLCLGCMIAISRFILPIHTGPEVVVGSLSGVVCIFLIAKIVLKRRVAISQLATTPGFSTAKPQLNIGVLVLLMITGAALTYGIKIPAEKKIGEFSRVLRMHLPFCE